MATHVIHCTIHPINTQSLNQLLHLGELNPDHDQSEELNTKGPTMDTQALREHVELERDRSAVSAFHRWRYAAQRVRYIRVLHAVFLVYRSSVPNPCSVS